MASSSNGCSIASPTFLLDLGPISTWNHHGFQRKKQRLPQQCRSGFFSQPGGNLHRWSPWPTGDSHLLCSLMPLKNHQLLGKNRCDADITSFPPGCVSWIFNVPKKIQPRRPCLHMHNLSIFEAGNHDGSQISRTSRSEHLLPHSRCSKLTYRVGFCGSMPGLFALTKQRASYNFCCTYLDAAIYCSGLVSSWNI